MKYIYLAWKKLLNIIVLSQFLQNLISQNFLVIYCTKYCLPLLKSTQSGLYFPLHYLQNSEYIHIYLLSACFSQRRIRRLRLTLHAGDNESKDTKTANSVGVSQAISPY